MLVGVVVIAMLPYTSTRCLDVADTGCPFVSTSHHVPEASPRKQLDGGSSGGASHDHENDHMAGYRHGTDADHSREHTCCELTGKDAFVPASPLASTAPAVVMVTPIAETHAPGPISTSVGRRPPVGSLHDPPPYLRFSSLLI